MNRSEKHTGQSELFRWKSAACTHVGKVRKVNEDEFVVNARQHHWVLADGMGGHKRGDVASQLVCDHMNVLPNPQDERAGDIIEDTLRTANYILGHEKSQEFGGVVGCTVAGLMLIKNAAYYYWVGDSRVYLFRNNNLKHISYDHTYENELKRRTNMSEEDIANHPEKDFITIAIGAEHELRMGNEALLIHDNDIFVLCSDGINKELKDSELETLIGDHQHDVELVASELLEAVLVRGARDNATAIVIKFNRLEI